MTTYHCYTSSLFYNWNFYTKWCHQLQIQDFVLGGKNSAGGEGGGSDGFQYYWSFSGRNFEAF